MKPTMNNPLNVLMAPYQNLGSTFALGMRRNAPISKALALMTNHDQHALLALAPVSALVEERTAHSGTKSAQEAGRRAALSSAEVGCLTAPGSPKTATTITGQECIMQGIAGQATDLEVTTGGLNILAISPEEFWNL